MNMFWKYLLFETKLLLKNRKNWFLGIVLMLFFPLYFIYFSQTEIDSLRDEKIIEQSNIKSIFNTFPEEQRETPEGEEVYQNIVQQSSLINFQIFYLRTDKTYNDYIDNGLQLNELRLELLELESKGIPKRLVKQK